MSNSGAEILAAGKALVRRISEAICNERATRPAAKRTSQSCSDYFFALPKASPMPSQTAANAVTKISCPPELAQRGHVPKCHNSRTDPCH